MLSIFASEKDDLSEIVPESVYMSNCWAAENLELLQKTQITHIVTVSGGMKPRYPQFFEYLVIPIDDTAEENVKKHFKQAIEFIDAALYPSDVGKDGLQKRVLVHCAAGISRSGSIVCAYLMWKQ